MRPPDFWGPATRGRLLPKLLSPLGFVYDLAGRLRRASAKPARVAVPVICVGNLVAGGAGKTPVALDLARRLAALGRSPHLLTRGYGGSERGPLRVDPARHDAATVGDEALLLAEAAPTWIGADRAASAAAAVAAGADLLAMDDGFQNSGLTKDLSLLVVDGGYGFGNRFPIPAGPLRERLGRGLARADAVVLIGEDRWDSAALLPPDLPLLRARLVPDPDTAEALRNRAVVAFAGIGRPEKFFETLGELGAELAATRAFPDHHPYGVGEVEDLLEEARRRDAVPVTTGKDLVRIPSPLRPRVTTLPVRIRWEDEPRVARLLPGARM